MTNKKTTKRALLTSIMALFLCFTMLLGTTYAWFTDSVSSGRNTISAGNLDIELDYYDGTEWKTVKDVTTLFKQDTLWEPGHTEVVYLRMTNKGTLSLKYQLGINVLSEVTSINVEGDLLKLSNIIEFGVVDGVNGAEEAQDYDTNADAINAVTESAALSTGYTRSGTMAGKTDTEVTEYMALVVYMPTTVGNAANYKTGEAVPSIDLGISVVATQYTNESDSFGNGYDKDAWAEGMLVYTEADLKAALANGGKVTLGADIPLSDTIEIPANETATYSLNAAAPATVLNLNGFALTADSTTYALKNLGNLVLTDSVGTGSISARGIYNGYSDAPNATLTVDSGTYNAIGTDGGAAIYNYGSVTITGGIFTSLNSYALNNQSGASMTIANASISGGIYNAGATLTVTDSNVENTRTGSHTLYAWNSTVELNNSNFHNEKANNATIFSAGTGVVTINGGKYTINSTSYLLDGGQININNGTFEAIADNNGIYNILRTYSTTIAISGGTFNADVSAQVADGYTTIDNGNGTWTVVKGEIGVSSNDALIEAIKAGETNIALAAGTYKMPDGSNVSLQGQTLTINGTRDAVIEAAHVDERDQYVTGANLTFEGVTLNFGTANYMGFANTASLTYKDCAINGLQFFYGSGTTSFENCDLNSNGAEHCAWTWGGQNISFTDCDFIYGDRAVNCYGENVTTNISFNNCTFTKVEGKETTGAIETNSSTLTALNLTINNCTVNEGDLWWVSTWDSKGGANTYTVIDGKVTVDTATQLTAVVAKGETNLYLMDGVYNIANCGGRTLTISGSRNAVITIVDDGESGLDACFDGSSVTFNGVTFDSTANAGSYKGFTRMTATYYDCAFIGEYCTSNYTHTFNNCEFNTNNGYIWTWGATEISFNGCEFGYNSKAILAHGSASTVININDCHFNATEVGKTGAGDPTAAVEIDPTAANTYTINFTGENTITEYYAGWTRVKDGTTGHTVTGLN